jgi:hypothetical protein
MIKKSLADEQKIRATDFDKYMHMVCFLIGNYVYERTVLKVKSFCVIPICTTIC